MTFVEYEPGLWCLQELYTRCFLVIGEERALLLDGGLGSVDLAAMVRELTNLPLIYVNSHAHTDHIGASLSFGENAWAHPAEMPYLTRALGDGIVFHEAQDGQVFDLGGTQLKVLYLPGHTPGSIGLVETTGKYFLCADLVSTAHVFLTGNYDIEKYAASLERVLSMEELPSDIVVYPAHGEPKVGLDLLDRELALTRDIMMGLEPVRQEHIPRDVRYGGEPAYQIPRIMDVYQKGTETVFRDAPSENFS